jgi:predicted Fe-Mo cluster-binding NifX family protein
MSAKRSKRSPGKHNSGYIKRYKKLLANGKNKGVVVTAIGRELLGFIWAIGIKVEAAQKESLQRAA